MLLVGSKALNYYTPKEYKDIDFLATMNEVEHFKEILNPEKIINKEDIITFINISKNDIFDRDNIEFLLIDNSEPLTNYYNLLDNHIFEIKVATKEILFSIKKSHIYYPIKFNKHIIDYNILYELCNGVDKLKDITKSHNKQVEQRLGKLKTPKLNKSTDEFFAQSEGFIKSYFVHDDIHLMVAHEERPIFEKLQENKDSVWCSKDLWNNLTYEQQIQCVLEEAYVISLERLILPFLYDGKRYYSALDALKWSLMRICTTLCSGYFRAFAVDNYRQILQYSKLDYIEKFLDKVDKGQINYIS